MDYSKLRAAALRDGEDEEAVTVDTRALIDKVLARYSGEWTTLRELIQNAADAQASTVSIRWETLPSTTVPLPTDGNPNSLLRHTILHHTLRRLLVENDGQPFTPTDWARLKRIAEGNPDETKIGAFGVGFYSVFADCEEPFVRSGREAMAFYWKGNALFTRKLVLPADAAASDEAARKTTFVLDYRNASTALPNLLSVSQFLATSLTFVALQRIEFWIDDWKILDLHKKVSPSIPIPLPRHLDVRTKEGLMTVATVDRSSAQIDASFLHVVSWKPPALTSESGSGVSAHTGGQASAGSKSTDTYGMSSGDLPSLRSFFSRFSSAVSSSSAQREQRNKAVLEEKLAQDSLLQNLTSTGQTTIFLRVTSAAVQTRVAANFASELERATKKPPPKTTKMAILTSSYEDVQASDAVAKPSAIASGSSTGEISHAVAAASIPPADIFASVLPSKKPGGRIFIGFPTMQTTGGGMHVSAPSLIPTVEREAIDLNARWVRNWNMELLRVAGILTRLAFIKEMGDLESKFRRHVEANRAVAGASAIQNNKIAPIPTAAEVAQFVPEALHILKTYTFDDSTPSAYVGQIIEEAFWTAYREPSLDIFSSRGVMSTSRVRMGNDEVSTFVDGIPVVVASMKDSPFIKKLHEFGIVQDVTVEDVRSELESKPLNRDQLVHFIKWLSKGAVTGELDPPSIRSMLRVAVASVIDSDSNRDSDKNLPGKQAATPVGSVAIIELRAIRNFLAGNRIPPTLPLPPSTIPFSITSTIPLPQLQALGWTQLDILPWLSYILSARATLGIEYNVTENASFAAQILTILSKNWDNLSLASRAELAAALKQHTVMPTRVGMRRPEETFFPSVKLFDDLPILSSSCQNLKEKFLLALGVRKTVDLDTIFTRLLSPATANSDGTRSSDKAAASAASSRMNWSHVELIKYLASVHGDIPSSDIARLRDTAFCPAEAGPPGKENTVPSSKLYRPNQLFEPSETVRALGFRIIQWPDQPGNYFRKAGPEAAFLHALNLRMAPAVSELEEKMESPDKDLRDKARTYFIVNHQLLGYANFRLGNSTRRIMPVTDGVGGIGSNKGDKAQEVLMTPSSCYTNPHASILGFPILRSDLHPHASKFGIARDPPIDECVKRLIAKPPRDQEDAVNVFTYFSTRLADLSGASLTKLTSTAFVPVIRTSSSARTATGFPVEKASQTSGPSSGHNTVEYVRPSDCYLGTSSTYGEIFDFVDFGVNGNAFLFKCGSRIEPTKAEIAHRACTEPARLLSTLQTPERYLNLLLSLAEDLAQLKKDRTLYRLMKSAPFLLASREISRPAAAPEGRGGKEAVAVEMDTDDEEPPIRQYQLVEASKIAIVDDYISYRLFKDKLLCAPEEDALESFYMALGAQTLSSIVQEDVRIGSVDTSQAQATQLRKFVLERSKIFLYEYQRYRRDAIKHDHRWLEKHLEVQMVQTVSLRRSLRGSSGIHTEKRSAAAASSSSGYILYVASRSHVDMYQVGQAICQLVLTRPSQQAYFFFEPFLKLGLLDLRARGYNVDRILRAKAAEARIAEEERRKALEKEQSRIAAAGQAWAQNQPQPAPIMAGPTRQGATTPERTSKMPGGFEDGSPADDEHLRELEMQQQQQHQQMIQDVTRKGRGLFSNLARRFGLDDPSQDSTETQPAVPPHEQKDGQQGTSSGTTLGDDDGRVTSPAAVQQNMLNAIRSTRPFGSDAIFQPPQTSIVKEQASYCDQNQAHDLSMVAQAPRGMRVFLTRALVATAAEFLAQYDAAVAAFEVLLLDVAGVYGVAPNVMHMYYDAAGPTIAFNTSGSIFCNLRYFLQLHAPSLLPAGGGRTRGSNMINGGQARVDATVWWWVVVAHELAHNLESSHNQSHSYYTESFVQQYFHRMVARASTWTTGSNGSTAAIAEAAETASTLRLRAPPSYAQATADQQRGQQRPTNLMD